MLLLVLLLSLVVMVVVLLLLLLCRRCGRGRRSLRRGRTAAEGEVGLAVVDVGGGRAAGAGAAATCLRGRKKKRNLRQGFFNLRNYF